MFRPARSRLAVGALATLAVATLAGCIVLDGDTLETVDSAELDGFLRVNGAGDHDGHVFVTASDGFHVFDTGLASDSVEFTGEVFEATTAGHATPHGGRTALFDDGTGDVRLFDTDAIGSGTLPEFETITSEAAHHGVALELTDGTILSTIGTSESRLRGRRADLRGRSVHQGRRPRRLRPLRQRLRDRD